MNNIHSNAIEGEEEEEPEKEEEAGPKDPRTQRPKDQKMVELGSTSSFL